MRAVTGSIAAAFNNKLLKRLINQSRPEAARKADPGMPSSHAQSLAFLSTYCVIGKGHSARGVRTRRRTSHRPRAGLQYAIPERPQAVAAGAAVAALGSFLAWLRVRLGFHTADQVLVGCLVGVTSASLWHWLGLQQAFPYMDANPQAGVYLWGITGLAVVAFAGKTVASWYNERSGKRD